MNTSTRNGVERLDSDQIKDVFISEPRNQFYSQYEERPSRYMVKVVGETRKRRVYAKPIGNVSVLYIKTKGKKVYCESALDTAVHRNGKEDA